MANLELYVEDTVRTENLLDDEMLGLNAVLVSPEEGTRAVQVEPTVCEIAPESINVWDVTEYLESCGMSPRALIFITRSLQGTPTTLDELRREEWAILSLSKEEYTEFIEEIPVVRTTSQDLLSKVGMVAKWQETKLRGKKIGYSLFLGSEAEKVEDEVTQKNTKDPATLNRKTRPKRENRNKDLTVWQDDSVKQYLKEIGQYPLLERGDEVALAKLIEAGIEARHKLDTDSGTMSAHQRRETMRIVKDGQLARTQFINSNLRLVVSIAKRYQRAVKTLELLDLIQEGNLGVQHAVDKYDWRKGFKFSTYSTWWIKQAITRGIANTDTEVRLPVHASAEVNKLYKARLDLEQFDMDVDDDALAAALDWSVETVRRVSEDAKVSRPVSYDAPLGVSTDSTVTLGDVVPDNRPQGAYDRVEDTLAVSGAMGAIKDALGERDFGIIDMRFGLTSREPKSLEEVGQKFGVTHERIRQIEQKSLSKLRHPTMRGQIGELVMLLE